MTTVQEIKQAIQGLPPDKAGKLREWFLEKDWAEWDKQIEADSEAGKLDSLINEALEDKKDGHTTPV